MNRLFVPIKVDREERPDIDHLYMNAAARAGRTGRLAADDVPDTRRRSPFWGGTYFPPEPRWGRPSFRQVLLAVAKAWERRRTSWSASNTAALRRALDAMADARPGDGHRPGALDPRRPTLLRLTDPVQRRPARARRNSPTRRSSASSGRTASAPGGRRRRTALHLMLRRMSQGGIYDHLGGGYARYATDAIWLVPHFEKMLYDNAQLLELLAFAHAEAPDPLYAARAAETVGWLERDMTRPPVRPLRGVGGRRQRGRGRPLLRLDRGRGRRRLLGPDAAARSHAPTT